MQLDAPVDQHPRDLHLGGDLGQGELVALELAEYQALGLKDVPFTVRFPAQTGAPPVHSSTWPVM